MHIVCIFENVKTKIMLKRNSVFFFIMAMMTFIACDKDDDSNSNLNLNISGLEDLGSTALYEGWLIVDGSPVTTGTFSVDANGDLSKTSFDVNKSDLENATTFVLTIEPSPDNDPAPSDVHILAGDFSGDMANITVGHGAALNNDFTNAAGKYILATPTNGSNNDENSGIWFLSLESGSPAVGLTLPTLPKGWAYEGWSVINGTPVSTGTFTEVNVIDDAGPFSGMMSGPPFPGEDFLVNAPAGLNFPVDLSGGKAVISIEPVPDNNAAPFLLKPLVGDIPIRAADHFTYDLNQNLNFPQGTVIK